MFNLLTKYLFLYKQVSIPSVGTIQLVQQPPQVHLVDKVIQPPTYRAEISAEEKVSDHQLNFLAGLLDQERQQVQQSLREVGERLKEGMQGDGFFWKGIGVLRHHGDVIDLATPALEPIPAEKILRADAEHSVLVGDQQMTSTQIAGLKEEAGTTGNRRSVFIIIGWILLILSILSIVFILYRGKFRVGSTGSRQAPTSWIGVPVQNFL